MIETINVCKRLSVKLLPQRLVHCVLRSQILSQTVERPPDLIETILAYSLSQYFSDSKLLRLFCLHMRYESLARYLYVIKDYDQEY